MTSRALITSLLAFGLLVAALVARNGDLALLALPLLAYLGAGILAAPVAGKLRLAATRSLVITPEREDTSVEVAVTVRNDAEQTVLLRLSDPLPPAARLAAGAPAHLVALAPGEATALAYTFRIGRGSFHWDSLRVMASDPFGFFECGFDLPAPADLRVHPRGRRLLRLPVRPRNPLNTPGVIPSRRAGSGTDFWGVREYHPGDPLRHVDWRLAARHPRELFTREFEQEDTADIGLILDARAQIDLRVGEDSLFEHMVGAAASLAEAFLHDGHRVSLLVNGDPVMTVFPGYSKGQLSRIVRALAKAQPSPQISHLSLSFLPLAMFSTRALIVVISPLTLGDRSIFSRLRARGNEILLVCPDPIRFAHSQLADGLAGRLGERAVRVERRLELRRIAQAHVRVIDWPVDQPLSPLLRTALRNSHLPRM